MIKFIPNIIYKNCIREKYFYTNFIVVIKKLKNYTTVPGFINTVEPRHTTTSLIRPPH